MNKRTFNNNCRLLWGKIKKTESRILTEETKHEMALHIIKNRGAVHNDLITNLFDIKWAHSMGYLYSKGNFLCTCENIHFIK